MMIGIQMVLAGIIVGTDAGFTCPSWPNCGTPGQVTSGLMFELVHRGVAAVLGILVIWLVVWLFRSYRHNRAMVITGSLGLLSLLVQITYAGLIVLFIFPGVATTVDVLNSVIMLSLFIHLANLAQREYLQHQTGQKYKSFEANPALRRDAWIFYVTGMIAVASGAVFRHTGASQALYGQDNYLLSHGQTVPPSSLTSHLLLYVHIATVWFVIVAGVKFARTAFKYRRLMTTSIFSLAVLVAQGILGVASLATKLQLLVVTMHWAVAGLLLATVAFALSKSYLELTPAKSGFQALSDNVPPLRVVRKTAK